MKKQKINILIFIIIIYSLSIANIVLPKNANGILSEKRTPCKKPNFSFEELFSGQYFKEYDNYFADNFIFRNQFINVSNKMNQAKGFNYENSAEILVFGGINSADDFTSSKEGNELNNVDKNKIEEELVDGTDFGRILIVNNTALEINTFNEEANKSYANSINYISENAGENVKTYSILVPSQIEFIEKDEYKDISNSQKKCIDIVNNNLNSEIKAVDIYTQMKDHIDEYIFFKTDHHWTPLGAYYAYREFIKTTGEEPLELEEYNKFIVKDFLGSLYNMTLSEKLAKNPDYIEVYIPNTKHDYWVYDKIKKFMGNAVDLNYMQKENKYSIYLGGDKPLGKIQTEVKNDKKILLIKDSYANSFVTYLIPHYEEIYMVDPRSYGGNIFKLIEENQIDEILFFNYVLVNRYDGFAKLFMKIAEQ